MCACVLLGGDLRHNQLGHLTVRDGHHVIDG